jgi:hypothetical protein
MITARDNIITRVQRRSEREESPNDEAVQLQHAGINVAELWGKGENSDKFFNATLKFALHLPYSPRVKIYG